MNEKKRSTKTSVYAVMILFVICLCIWIMIINKNANANPKQTSIPFSYNYADDIDPETLTNDIMQAIEYPDAVPIVTKLDRFRVVLHNHPTQQETDLGLHSLTSSFTIRVPKRDDVQILSYEFQATPNGELVITYRKEITYEGRPNEQPHPTSGFTLNELFSAVRDFPVVSYRELTAYGNESADLYAIEFNEGGPLLGQDFSYNVLGTVQNDGNENKIPFLISHMQWGEIRDDSLAYDDPHRYYSFGGEGRANLYYYPES